jgi:hypothetical protein
MPHKRPHKQQEEYEQYKERKDKKRKEKNAHKHRLYLAIATHKTTVKKRKLIHS